MSELRESELMVLAQALREARGEPAPSALWRQLVVWADRVRADYALLELVLRGELLVDWSPQDDDWVFIAKDQS